ncbi:GDSL-type esterase/lipase family protein [uncultured Pseudodesulfovibrio sp.]|uniref:GDSL-type esterase/lipase family protein n=1 Tax=uncultured Pseudodesulfovibrio sp. TaxID=2035858 RepID=UPI0029C6B06F|nr:GDSL-type esterase/lipase family protein [uncultured Pseudodesulfovibrio sp.]
MVICFFGDSLTLGFGDETGLGWLGRIHNALIKTQRNVTSYNLGVRKDTTTRLELRWKNEAGIRSIEDMDLKLVFSFGVADIMNDVPPQDSLKAARNILNTAQTIGSVLCVGPTPVSDANKNARIKTLSTEISKLCDILTIPYIPTFDSMEYSAVYDQALSDGDTVHPTAAGYTVLADHILQHKSARTFFGLE